MVLFLKKKKLIIIIKEVLERRIIISSIQKCKISIKNNFNFRKNSMKK